MVRHSETCTVQCLKEAPSAEYVSRTNDYFLPSSEFQIELMEALCTTCKFLTLVCADTVCTLSFYVLTVVFTDFAGTFLANMNWCDLTLHHTQIAYSDVLDFGKT